MSNSTTWAGLRPITTRLLPRAPISQVENLIHIYDHRIFWHIAGNYGAHADHRVFADTQALSDQSSGTYIHGGSEAAEATDSGMRSDNAELPDDRMMSDGRVVVD